jgi:CheY-like chemotaxis protein
MPDTEQRTSVLVADDSAIYRKLVEHALSDNRFSLTFAKSGQEAIQLFHEREPDLVIVDWVMPDLTGIEICEHVRVSSKALYTSPR